MKIRKPNLEDSLEISNLCIELGYSSTELEIREKLKALENSESDSVLVAVDNNIVIGWIHTIKTTRLESSTFAEIVGLIVSKNYRNKGIGKALVAEAEKWSKENGCLKIRVRCRTERVDAHRFYERENYQVLKVQSTFEKNLE
jgi:GNAT superfamily N-acetyltransferase